MKGVVVILSIVVVIYGCAIQPGQESFNVGQGLVKGNRLEEAIAMLEDAVAKEPQNMEYMSALRKAQELLSSRHLEKARTILAQSPATYDRAMSALQEAEKALRLVPGGRETKSFTESVKAKIDEMGKKAEAMYADAAKAIAKDEWADGFRKLKEISKFYPNYLDTARKLREAEENSVSYYIKEAEKYKKSEDWGKVLAAYLAAQEISPDRSEVAAGLKDARAKHTPTYYLEKMDEYKGQNDWDRAMRFAEKAASLGPQDEGSQRITMVLRQAAQHFINQCSLNLNKKQLYSAYSNAMKAIHDSSIKNDPAVSDVLKQLLGAMAEKAAFYENQGRFGNAYTWYEKITGINPNYQDIFFKIQLLRDKLRARVIQKIAIMEFTSPSGQPDAGKRITSSLLAHATTQAGSDIKVLVRDKEILGDILKEIELVQSGLSDIESIKKRGGLRDTDAFIYGSVLSYNVDTVVSEGYKTVNVVVGKKTVPNPLYQTWLLLSQKGTKEEIRNAPPAFIEEDIRETFKYKVGTVKKRATVGVSFRVIELEKGEVIIAKNVEKIQETKDDYSEGVEAANIKYKAIELPPDSELLEKVAREVIAELSYEVLSRFQNVQTRYFNLGETYKKRREYEKAVEKFSDAIHLEEMKNISSPLSENARKEIEQLLKLIAL